MKCPRQESNLRTRFRKPLLTHILLGHRAWKLPSTLGRALPNVDIEGEQLTHHLAESDAHVEPSQPATTSWPATPPSAS